MNVRDFGAKGDGKTDDSAAIQRAIDEAKARVVLPPGTYRIGKTLNLNDAQVSLAGINRLKGGLTLRKKGE